MATSQPERQHRNLQHWRLLTPHKISLLILLDKTCLSNRDEAALAPLLFLLLRHIQSGAGGLSEPTLDSFCRDELDRLPYPSVGLTVKDILLAKLAELDSPDDLFDYMEELASLMEDTDRPDTCEDEESTMKLEPKSVFGVFLRRAIYDYRASSFDDCMQLYEALSSYRQGGEVAERPQESAGSLFQMSASPVAVDHAANGVAGPVLTRRDSALFVDHIINSLESGRSSVLPPAQLHEKLQQVAAEAREVVNVHYACYLNYARCGDYESARSSLYQYFDYCSRDVVNSKNFYPCILLNFTALYATFGYLDMARETILEAIEVARERRDKELLVYCLKWLCQLGASPNSHVGWNCDTIDMVEALDVVAARAKGYGVAHMQSLAELTKAKCALQGGEPPPHVFEPLVRSCFLDFRGGLTGLTGNLHAMCDAVWDTYGSHALSSLHNHIDLQMYRKSRRPEDVAAGYCRLAIKHADQGDFRRAFSVLAGSELQVADSVAARKACARARLELLYNVAAAHGEHTAGDIIINELAALAKTDGESASLMRSWEASQSARYGRFLEAVAHIRGVIDDQSQSLTPLAEVESVFALVEIHMVAGEPLTALPYVLRFLSLSERLHSPFYHLFAIIQMAAISLALGLNEKAMELMEEIMPDVVSQGKVYLEATGYLTYAECILACMRPGYEEDDGKGKSGSRPQWRTALRSLEKALSGFSKLQMNQQVQHVLYIQARTYDHLNMRKERNAAAREHRRVTAVLARARRAVPSGFGDLYV